MNKDEADKEFDASPLEMKLNIPCFVLLVICCVRCASPKAFCETYWRDEALVLGCVGFIDTIQYNLTLEGVTEVNLIKNDIPTLNSKLLANLTLVHTLFLTFNMIEQVEEDSFSNFANVTTINLSFNNIKDLPETVFQNNYNLLNLSLRKNAIDKLKENMLSKLLDLKTIDLSMNSIEHVPQNFFANNGDLEVIDLRENQIRDLPEEVFDDLAALKEIDLSYNHLEVLSPHLFKYNYNLEIIRVRGNKITMLDYSVTHLNLKVFDLFKNPLRMDNKEVRETLTALERTGVKMYLNVHRKHGHGHKKESVVTVPTYVKTILVLSMFVITLLLVAVSGLIAAFFTKLHKKAVRPSITSTDSQECLITEDNYLKLKVPNGIAVYVKNSQCGSTSSTENENATDDVCRTSCDSFEMKSPVV